MTLLDVVLLVLVGMAIVNGFRRGAVLQLFAYAGLLLGLFAGALLAPRVAGILEAPPSQAGRFRSSPGRPRWPSSTRSPAPS